LYGNEIRLLGNEASKYGIALSEQQLVLFQIYLDELWAWSQRTNLTGLSNRRRIAFELFLDSLIPAPFFAEAGRLLDVGSGAGCPGIPLKIYRPGLVVHLLESNTKKGSFLKQIVRLLKLTKTAVIRGRIEASEDHLHSEGYHIIATRALARLGQAVTWCVPKLSSGGLLVSYLGRRAEDEIKKNRQILEEHHLVLHKVVPYSLPGMPFERKAVIFAKKEG
jgi:16S rRNA (guanine527-N7)-methyltransferase